MTASKVIDRLLLWAPQCFEAMPLVRERCILATRVGIDVLARFGIAAEPRSVICSVSNQGYEQFRCWLAEDESRAAYSCTNYQPDHNGECLNCDESAEPHPPPGAWAVWAGLPPEIGSQDRPKAWWGHLVVFVPTRELILDLDFQQFERPNLGLPVPPAIRLPWPSGRSTTGAMINIDADDLRGTLFIHYQRNDDNQRFVAAPDWNSDRDYVRAAVDAIERAIRKG